VEVREVKHAFVKKLGANKDDSGDHIYFYLDYQGSEYAVGKLSHSWRGALNDTQITMLSHKLHLKKSEFEGFVDCSLTTPEMLKIWQERRQTAF
jgi:hypothetical protein